MTWAEFKKKWHRYTGKESSAYQEHFNDLCRMLGHPTPVEADPSGEDFFCFQKGVIKDAELLGLDESGSERTKKGFADVWYKDHFGWEYKGKHKNLAEAYNQLLRYRESLLNPPLMVVCDFDRYIIKTNFNGTVQVVHEFKNAQLDDPRIIKLLRDVFFDPNYLRPLQTTAEVTEILAAKFAAVSRSLQGRESVELEDAFTRRELRVAQKKNLRIARFLNRVMFCFFAEDTGLLPKKLFSEIARTGLEDKQQFAESLEQLFRVMSKGGLFGHYKIRHFNGHLFEDVTVFELTDEEISLLADAAESDWQFIQPGIMGTLFERALDGEGNLRAQLGAHYTSEVDIKVLVEPVLMAPFRQEWDKLREEVREIHLSILRNCKPGQKLQATATGFKRHSTTLQYNMLNKFVERLAAVRVLDPACGSGNFLYVSLQLLLGLEKEVLAFGTEIDVAVEPRVGVQQLLAIEINSYAFELAQVSVQIGFLQWRRDNGFDNDRSPVLQNLDGFQNEDALLVPHFRSKAKTLKEAQAGEHEGDDALKFYTEREWPKCDVIVGNPPFLGDKLMRGQLGDGYVEELRRIYDNRIPGQSDLCCYWFEKARAQIESNKCKRAGLLATQGIRGGANREVLKRIKDTGDIFFAESDRDWILAGATVHVSMVGFDNGSDNDRRLNGKPVATIHPQLTADTPTGTSTPLRENESVCFIGTTKKAPLDVSEAHALEFLDAPNPTGHPNSDVVLPWMNGLHVTRRAARTWIIDFPMGLELARAAGYAEPFAYVEEHVKPLRVKHREAVQAKYWWRQARPCPELRALTRKLARYCATPRVAKHRIVCWIDAVVVPDCQLVAFARDDDYFYGIVHSRFHEVWSLAQGTQLREKESGFRYTPTTCFETFPFPFVDDLQLRVPSASRPDKPDSGWDEVMEKRFYTLREEPPAYQSAGSSRREEALTKKSEIEVSLVTSAATKEQHRAAIAAAAQELNALRERWLNPPEWTRVEYLEFPASVDGPWARYVECGDSSPLSPPDRLVGQAEPRSTARGKSGGPVSGDGDKSPRESGDKSPHSKVGIARYPRLVPKDADCAVKLKKRTLTNLYNERPPWLEFAHKKLDAAVAAAYGWVRAGLAEADLTDEQILEKLLALNLERAATEAQVSKVKQPKAQRAKSDHELI